MKIHAESDKQKRTISVHIVTGRVCKNCQHFSASLIFPSTGYCSFFNHAGLGYNDFCSVFKEQIKRNDN